MNFLDLRGGSNYSLSTQLCHCDKGREGTACALMSDSAPSAYLYCPENKMHILPVTGASWWIRALGLHCTSRNTITWTNIGESSIKSAETKVNKWRCMHINPIKASEDHLVHYHTLSEVNINQILSNVMNLKWSPDSVSNSIENGPE